MIHITFLHDVNILGENITNRERNTEALLQAIMEDGLEVNIEKTKYMVTFRHQNAGEELNILIANKSVENVGNFKHLRKTVTNQNCVREEINDCYRSVQSHLSSYLFSKT
jgi:hypothetical protein